MTMLPATNDTSKQNVLLATGFINLGELGNVSAAFYDGQTWIPYLVTSDVNGASVASLSSLFFLDQPYIVTVIKSKFLPTYFQHNFTNFFSPRNRIFSYTTCYSRSYCSILRYRIPDCLGCYDNYFCQT